ncbi:MAG: carboxypeptidase regulatory-like domain-containing protein [Deltaproteobacteria bacterium]|nr:carboxypeptidase regulatory-like domain-containing protein [Deltaproteobacteria bacterium]
MTKTKDTFSWVTLVCAALLAPLSSAAVAELKVHEHDGVAYVSGGVGTDERHEIEALAAQFNLKLTMALSDGHFISDTQVQIRDAKGSTLVEAASDGPLFYAKLPPGSYTVVCSLNGKEVKRSATVTTGKQQRLTFTWSSE